MLRGGDRILVRERTSHKISYMNSSQVLHWRRQNVGSGGHSAKMYSSKTFEKFLNLKKNFHNYLKNSPKFFKTKI